MQFQIAVVIETILNLKRSKGRARNGLALTLLSGLFQTPFAPIFDVVRMGAPLTWTQHVVPSSLYFTNWSNLVADWIFGRSWPHDNYYNHIFMA
jgi:hypothetical protein